MEISFRAKFFGFSDLQGSILQAERFFQAGVGVQPSYVWRSILFGRELLEKGLIKSIGNGISIKVWLDNWILDEILVDLIRNRPLRI